MQIPKCIPLVEICRNLSISLFFLAVCVSPPAVYAQEADQNIIKSPIQMNDESAAKAVVDSFLTALGNDEPDKVRTIMLPNANIAYFSTSNGKSIITTITADQFISQREGRQNKKFKEPVKQYTVNISQGKLAFVRADATVFYNGKPSHHTNDFFILMKDSDVWKILSGSYTAQPLENDRQ